MRIYHLTTADVWAAAQRDGWTSSTRGVSLEEEGFVHCSRPHQVDGVRERFFDGVADLVLLEIETDRLTVPWRFDPVPGSDEEFPHVYGPVDLDAVVSARAVSG